MQYLMSGVIRRGVPASASSTVVVAIPEPRIFVKTLDDVAVPLSNLPSLSSRQANAFRFRSPQSLHPRSLSDLSAAAHERESGEHESLRSSGLQRNSRLVAAVRGRITPRSYVRVFSLSGAEEEDKKEKEKEKEEEEGSSGSLISIWVGKMLAPVWSYPMKGFYFFFRNGLQLWHRVARFILEVILAVVVVLFCLMKYTFGLHRHFLLSFLLFPQWAGTAGAVGLVVLETVIMIVLLFRYRLESAQRKLFVDVLQLRKVKVERVTEDERRWISERLIPRLLNLPTPPPSTKRVARQAKPSAYLNLIVARDRHPILHYFLTLPLNFVPVVGNAIFCWVNAFPTATSLHHYYYTEMKGLSEEETSAVVHAKKAQYQHFGVVASALSLVPGLDIMLVLTNAVGAALWAADMEKIKGSVKTKWSLETIFDKGERIYNTFIPSSSGEPSRS